MSSGSSDNLKISSVFQRRLSGFITELDCKRKDLSECIGVSKAVTTRALIFGIIPKPVTLMKLADRFNASIDYLIGLTDNRTFIKTQNPKSFQIRFEELKSERNLKNNQISLRLPIDRSYFSIWKRENYIPSLDFLVLLAQFFKVSIDYLLGRSDER